MKLVYIIFTLFFGVQAFAQTLNNNLLTQYSFDGHLNDRSGNNYHATGSNISYIDDRFNNSNGAIYYNGVDSYIDFPNAMELKPDLPLSISFWIKYDSNLSTDREVFNTSFEEDISSGVFFNSEHSTGKYSLNFGDGTSNYTSNTRRSYASNASIETGQWTHIVLIIESETNMKIYVDCVDYGGTYSGFGGPLYYSNTPGSFGRHDRSMSTPANYFKGALDDFRYWDKALSNTEVQFVCDPNLNLENIILNSDIRLFPNPAQDHFEIISPVSFEKIQIYDLTGKIVLTDIFNPKQNITGLKSGVYFVSLLSDELIVRKKLVIK